MFGVSTLIQWKRKLRYDYRTEWMRFSLMLFANEDRRRLSTRVIKAIADRVASRQGVLFEWEENRGYVLKDCWKGVFPDHNVVVERCRFTDYLEHAQRAIEFSMEDGLQAIAIPPSLKIFDWAGIVVPLLHGQHLHAFVLLAKPEDKAFTLNWELLDILSMAGRQAVVCLVEEQSTQALAIARQFEGYNRLSAFVMHDLKNVLSQLKLIKINFEKHGHEPAFIQCTKETLSHVTEKLDRLLLQMRTRQEIMKEHEVKISEVLKKVIELTHHRQPVPRLDWQAASAEITVKGDDERFVNILCHLIENAQQATPENGEVILSVKMEREKLLIGIQDTGCGMDPEFIHHSLYKPFVTTKAEKGTGIGVYEAREYLSTLGGKFFVKSEKNKGSLFNLEIPLAV
jgi:putative PEP-CTERM system histidine kinase